MSDEKPPEPPPPVTDPIPESSSDEVPLEKEIDLNMIFPDAETDLNALFPDAEMKHLLKKVSKNRQDLHAMKDRFLEENETEGDQEEP